MNSPEKMKVVIWEKSGPPEVLQLQEIPKPVPADNEVLVKIYAGTVTRGDAILRKLRIPRIGWFFLGLFGFPPKKYIPGHEIAGEIEAIGRDVTKFKVGDQVFGTTSGLRTGGNAEYVCLPEEWKDGVLALKPSNISYGEAAALCIGGMTALHILRKGNIQNGDKVLIYGASGSVGTFALQLAKNLGASSTTGICSTSHLEMVKSLGADFVYDYTNEESMADLFASHGESYDVIFDAVIKIPKKRYKRLLKRKGTFLSARSSTEESMEKILFLRDLAEAGKLKSVVDRSFPLEQVVEAHRYVEKGHKAGNVVITVKYSNDL